MWKYLLILPALAGCTSIELTPKGSKRLYLGALLVTVPDRQGDLAAYSVKGLGAGWQSGPWLGWRSDHWVSADPAKCQMLVVIRSAAEAENATKVLERLKGEDICVADYTSASRR